MILRRYLFAWAGGQWLIREQDGEPLSVAMVTPAADQPKTPTGLVYRGLLVAEAWKAAGKPGLVTD